MSAFKQELEIRESVKEKEKKKGVKGDYLENPKSIYLDLEKKQTDPRIFLKQEKLECKGGQKRRMLRKCIQCWKLTMMDGCIYVDFKFIMICSEVDRD